jgi:hypothetical protein
VSGRPPATLRPRQRFRKWFSLPSSRVPVIRIERIPCRRHRRRAAALGRPQRYSQSATASRADGSLLETNRTPRRPSTVGSTPTMATRRRIEDFATHAPGTAPATVSVEGRRPHRGPHNAQRSRFSGRMFQTRQPRRGFADFGACSRSANEESRMTLAVFCKCSFISATARLLSRAKAASAISRCSLSRSLSTLEKGPENQR